MHLRVFSYLIVGFMLSAAPLFAKETVMNVGKAFTCYFQNAGDAGRANQDLGGASCKNWTKEEIECVRFALQAWDNVIEQAPSRRVSVGLYWIDFAAKGRGGSMGGSTVQLVPPSKVAPGGMQIFTRPERVWRDGVQLADNRCYDILLCFNNRAGLFYYGVKEDRSIGARHDFRSVIMHEVGHGLGITSAVRGARPMGAGMMAVYQTFNNGKTMLFTTFDGLMRNAKGERVVERAVMNMAKTGVAGGFNTGEKITLAGSPLSIYNPPRFKGGSSITHVDKADALMRSSFAPGMFRRKITKEEQHLMKLMGWKIKGDKSAPLKKRR